MGLLDDAIREHLDLKRRRGADPAEVEQAEREALGPVRRDPFEHADDLSEDSVSHDPAYDRALDEEQGEEAFGEEEEGDWGEAFEEEEFVDERSTAAHQPGAASDEVSGPYPGGGPESDLAGHPAAAEPSPAGIEPHAAERSEAEETVEYDVEQAFDDEHSEVGHHESPPAEGAHGQSQHEHEDVLEETPEFLQDTPDHDRLWFEQRPPRDFDFDG
jgi:FtsZ-interacting cell division protein ZipA